MNLRSFFNRIARAAAIVALAPQIAFRAPRLKVECEVPTTLVQFWKQTMRRTRMVDEDYRKAYEKLFDENQEFVTLCGSRDAGKAMR